MVLLTVAPLIVYAICSSNIVGLYKPSWIEIGFRTSDRFCTELCLRESQLSRAQSADVDNWMAGSR